MHNLSVLCELFCQTGEISLSLSDNLISALMFFLQHYAEIVGSLTIMLELGSCSVSSQSLTDEHNALGPPTTPGGPECLATGLGMAAMCGGSPPRRHILHLSPTDCEGWQKHRAGLAGGSGLYSEAHSLLEPQSLSTSYDTLYLPHVTPGQVPLLNPNRLCLSLDVAPSFDAGAGMVGVDGDLAVSPNVIKRRRGGLIEQRDIIKAHQAHKIHSTPQARRKEWE